MIARIAGTLILSAIVFVVVVSLLESVGVYRATDGRAGGALIGIIRGAAAAFTVGGVGTVVERSGR